MSLGDFEIMQKLGMPAPLFLNPSHPSHPVIFRYRSLLQCLQSEKAGRWAAIRHEESRHQRPDFQGEIKRPERGANPCLHQKPKHHLL